MSNKSIRISRHKIVPSSYLILIKDNKLLLGRRRNTGFKDGDYGLISGHGEENESAIQALIRESRKEAGIIIKPEDVNIAHIMYRKSDSSETENNERIDFFFTTKRYV
jgi:8-oxo-dGTP pyrophosphatase MutT (NUDIX family)